MERKIKFAPDEYYHVYNRGVNKSKIFIDRHASERFMMLLYLSNSYEPVHLDNLLRNFSNKPLNVIKNIAFNLEKENTIIDIGAYCLMPNHFHLLVREKEEGGISKFMQKITTAYTMYANRRHNRTGSLFGGTFHATHANDDLYLKYLFAYIHLNPIKLIESKWKETGISDKKRAKKYLDSYHYSSYIDYQNIERPENKILDKRAFPAYFQNQKAFSEYINDWLSFKYEE